MRRMVASILLLAATPGFAQSAEHIVTLQGFEYVPAELSAKVGDTIRFVNKDEATHDVFVPTLGHATDLGNQEAGTEKVLALRIPGTFEVECVHHLSMLLTVTVSE